MKTIAASVGRGGRNHPIDVIKIQNMLNNNGMYTGVAGVPITGEVGPPTVTAITNFQTNHPELTVVDGRVDPRGGTIKRLRQAANDLNKVQTFKNYLPASFSRDTFSTINATQFAKLCALQRLCRSQTNLKKLMTSINNDSDVTRISWAAYMLATTKHETAHTFEPIAEYGKGKGKKYGETVKVTDPLTKKVHNNVYYGRGFVQLTWEENYEAVADALRLTGPDNIHVHPDKAMDFEIAYKCMSYGMRTGIFRSTGGTRNTMAKYLNGKSPDYFNARDIINGYNSKEKQLDKADTIANYAKQFEFLLRFCNGAKESSPLGTAFPGSRPFRWLEGIK